MHRLWEWPGRLMSANLDSTCCLGARITAHTEICQTPGVMRILPKTSLLQAVGMRRSLPLAADCPCRVEELSSCEAALLGVENRTSSGLTASHPAVPPGFDTSRRNRSQSPPGPLLQGLRCCSEGAQAGQARASQNLAMPSPSLPFPCDKGALRDREGRALQARRCLLRSGSNVVHGLISYLRRE